MLSILKYLNKRQIDTTYIIIYALFILIMIYIFDFPYINLLIILDIYLFLYFTFFKMNTKFRNKIPFVKIDITQEGVTKEEINMKSLMEDYLKKFSSK
jgi:hypothetical protein